MSHCVRLCVCVSVFARAAEHSEGQETVPCPSVDYGHIVHVYRKLCTSAPVELIGHAINAFHCTQRTSLARRQSLHIRRDCEACVGTSRPAEGLEGEFDDLGLPGAFRKLQQCIEKSQITSSSHVDAGNEVAASDVCELCLQARSRRETYQVG